MSREPTTPERSSPPSVVLLRDVDDVAVACRLLRSGEVVVPPQGSTPVTLRDDIPQGHKLAVRGIPDGGPIRKYGQIIGFASGSIQPGSHVHVHNCEARPFERSARPSSSPERRPAEVRRTFRGYPRPDGRVGTRNYVAVVSTVNCSASVSRHIAERASRDGLREFAEIDGILAITHKAGCGLQENGPDHQQLARTLAGFASHPNVAACLVVGLGCEVGSAGHLLESLKMVHLERPGKPAEAPQVLTIQETGGISRTVEAGVKAVRSLLPRANEARRQEAPASRLILGLQCGGSDGLSGITANPALGVASDHLVEAGGTSVLAETPEMYGAEHLLTGRAISPEVAAALVERIRWWEWYTGIFGATIDNNPAPGNKEGGLTTIYEKSLGAIAKGGSAPLTRVYRYAERIDVPGLVVMDSPGYDPVSMTGIVAGGANIAAFTTGRGSVYGCKPTPCIKITSNTRIYERMEPDMDIDAGSILRGTPIEEVGLRIFEKILSVASGERTKSEISGVGDEEFAPWSIGPTL